LSKNFLKDELKGYGPVVLLRSTFGRFDTEREYVR
jgi:hypothetical protein